MDGFQVELLRRLPLADAVLSLFAYVLDEPFLDRLFEEHRGRCYQDTLRFATLVYLVRDALLVHDGSGRQSFDHAREAGTLPVAVSNAYAKLGRLPAGLSAAMVAEGTARLGELLPAAAAAAGPVLLPTSLQGFEVVAGDGKKIKKAAKRLKALRGLPGKLLGGKLLAALSLRTGLVVAMHSDPDGERNDVPLVPGLLPQVRAKVAGPVLWVLDRQFCDLNVPTLLTARAGDHFLIRWSKKLTFHADPTRPAREGQDAEGRRFVQEWGWVGGAADRRRRYVRRVTLCRPGEEDVAVLTDLLDERAYPAEDLLAAYGMRWGIENVFQQVTEVFELRRLIGSTPDAMVFQAAFCVLLYNLIQVVRAYVAAAAGREPGEVSTEKLFADATHELVAWAKAGDASAAPGLIDPPRTPAQMRQRLRARLGGPGVWTDRWLKAPPKKKPRHPPPPQAKVAKGHGGHTSVWRILQEYKLRQRQQERVT